MPTKLSLASGARKTTVLVVAVLCTAVPSNAEESDSISINRISEEAIVTGELAPLETLYSVLEDPLRREEWYPAIKQIAAHGRSNKSSEVLLAFVKRGLTEGLGRIATFQEVTWKMTVFTYLSLTGGREARQAMRNAFLNEHAYLTAQWLPRIVEVAPDQGEYSWENSLRGRAATGLLLSGNRRDEDLVRQFFRDIHRNGPIYDESLGSLSSILLDSFVIADMAETHGKTYVLFIDKSCLLVDGYPSAEKYLKDDQR